MRDSPIKTHTFVFNNRDNSGEHVSLTTKIFHNGDREGGIFYNQDITLQSYCNYSTIGLIGCNLTPESLRKLADELEAATNEAQEIVRTK